MSDKHPIEECELDEHNKYERPLIIEHGEITELTRGGGGPNPDGAGFYPIWATY